MGKKKQQKPPTDLELSILNIVWERGSVTVEDVQSALPNGPAYTTVQALLTRMTEKGQLLRVKDGRAHRYAPRMGKQETKMSILRRMMAQLFGGSARALMLDLMQEGDLSVAEIRELEQLAAKKRREEEGPPR